MLICIRLRTVVRARVTSLIRHSYKRPRRLMPVHGTRSRWSRVMCTHSALMHGHPALARNARAGEKNSSSRLEFSSAVQSCYTLRRNQSTISGLHRDKSQ
ncbi:hypothetical protein NDU88_000416 [Pleurodeles waltl]|uniref:Secreted protein n=1 Tax=Pleurodeles waltl TaxID=8319 RepID=A0AAV7V8Y2_PLEWA|nr:hypothetical protein NDU88_000416 [Pleurodeles waltl]